MDFIDILIKGYASISGENLHERYKSDAKKALLDGCSYMDFFVNCGKAIISIKAEMDKQFELELSQINDNLSKAKSENNVALEDKCYMLLRNLKKSDIKINLSRLSKLNTSQIRYERLSFISMALDKAEKELTDECRTDVQKSPLSDNQIELLFKNTKNKYIQTTYENFYNICKGAVGFSRIVWIHKNRGGSYNKTSLNCFWNVLMGCKTKPTDKIINKYFVLDTDARITLSSPNKKQTTYNEYMRKFANLSRPEI